MAESKRAQRLRSLGLLGSEPTSSPVEAPTGGNSSRQSRLINLGLKEDSRPKGPDRADLLRNDRMDLINQGYDPNPVFKPAPTPVADQKFRIPALDFLNDNIVEPTGNFLNRAAATATDGMTLFQGKKQLLNNPDSLVTQTFQNSLRPAETTAEKAADIVGNLYGMVAPTFGAYATGGKLATKVFSKVSPKIISAIDDVGRLNGIGNASKFVGMGARGLGAGLAYEGTKGALDYAIDPQGKTMDERLKEAALGTAMFAGGDAALGVIGPALGSGIKALRGFADNTATGLSRNAIQNVAENSRSSVASPFAEGAAVSNPIARGYTENVGRTFDVPPSNPISGFGPVVDQASQVLPRAVNKNPLVDAVNGTENQTAATTQGVRANYQNQLNNGNFSDELQQGIRNTDQTYDRVTNAESIAAANVAVKDLSAAESKFLLNQTGGPDHIATGYRLMQELDALGNHDRALVVANKLAKDLTKSGQTSQAAAILSRLSPEGQLLNLVRTAEKNGKTVSGADSVNFKNLAAKVQEKSGAGIRANQFNEILNRLERGENVSVDDIQKLSKFLSGSDKVIKPNTKVIPVKDNLPAELKEPRKRDKIVSFLDDAEQAALARIAARKNNLNSLPVNEWADHAIVVASQIAKGTIKAATHIEDMVKMFGEEIRPVATQVFQNAQKLISGVSTRAAEGNLQKANEAFTRISGVKKDTTLQEKIVEKYLKENPKVSPKDIDTLRELAKNVTRLSGDQKIDADIAMQKILNSYEKSSAWDKVQALRYMGMLLNTGTQLINAGSGPIMASTGVVADVFGTMLDIAMNKVLKTPRTTTLYGTNPLKFLARYMKNLKTGVNAGRQGVNPAGIQGTNEIRGLAFKDTKNPLTFIPAMGERLLGAVAKGPDYAAYMSVFSSEMEKQGFLSAINSGIKRSNKPAIEAHIRKFINDPPAVAALQADRIGKNTTFQRSDTTGGKLANHLNNSPRLVKPGVTAIFPFVRTPVNMASTAVTMTPAGIIKGLYQLTSKSDASRREAIRTLSLGLTGSAGLGSVGYYLHQVGIITGANDSGDKDADNIREQAGQGKYRFNTSALMRYLGSMFNGEGSDAAEKAAKYQQGDKQFDYNKLQPLAFPVAIGASLSENKDKPALDRVAKAGEDAFGSLFGMSTLRGLQDVFQPQYGGTVGEKALGTPIRLAESFFKSFSPGGLAQEARRQDPSIRKVPFNDGIIPDVTAYFKSRTPGLSQSLPPSKTTLGQTKMNAPGISGQYLNPYKSEVAPYNDAAAIISKLIDSTGDLSLAPSAPDKKVTGKDKITKKQVTVTIPVERYSKLQEDVGSRIIKDILALDSKLTDDKKIEKIKQIYSDVKEKERIKIKKEFGIQVN